MRVSLTPADLIAFEDEIAELFLAKRILAPVHLAGGNEEQLIDLFRRHVDEADWVLTTWRSHYHALLKGVPPAQVRQAILGGRSISLCFPEHRVLSSAIVGGTAPIAVGLAMGIARRGGSNKVVCFVGDMAAETGIVHESVKYAANHGLPLLWVVEDNGMSVLTDTAKAWGGFTETVRPSVIRYAYKLTRPHVGVGEWVAF